MHIYSNHCYCLDSLWGGHYDCRYILSIDQHKDDEGEDESLDWNNTLVGLDFIDEVFADKYRARRPDADEEEVALMAGKETFRLKPEVTKWLEENVLDRVDEKCPKGWCVGSDSYNANSLGKFNIFFHRKTDALNFIKRWSEFSKPETDFNYFSGRRMKLNQATMKMNKVERFD